MQVLMSEEAYKEFKDFLVQNNIVENTIRIKVAAIVCSGPIFNIAEEKEEAKDSDVAVEVGDLVFITTKIIADEYGGFVILSNKESGYNGLYLKALELKEGGCDNCTQVCH